MNNGGIYLFQAKDDEEMGQWVNSINQQTAGGAAGGATSQTLPAGAGRTEDPAKKKGFFTLKGSKK